MKKQSAQMIPAVVLALLFTVALPGDAFANFFSNAAGSAGVGTIAENIVRSSATLPDMLSGLSYLMGLLFGVLGVFKLKDHVENPARVEFKDSIIRFVAGGALISLPIVYEAMKNTIGDGTLDGVAGWSTIGVISGFIGMVNNFVPLASINHVMSNIISSFSNVPGLISGVAYMLGLVLGVSGILKLKEHVDNPAQVGMREPTIRFLVGGALFALPAIYSAAQNAIAGGGSSGIDIAGDAVGLVDMILSGGKDCNPGTLVNAVVPGLGGFLNEILGFTNGGPKMSDLICNLVSGTSVFPALLIGAAYLFGIVLGLWGLLRLKAHVLSPQQVPLWDVASKFLACGAFLSLPVVVSAIKNTMGNDPITNIVGLILNIVDMIFGDSGPSGGPSGNGLDAMLVGFMGDIYGPFMFMLNWFGYVAGMVLVMVGISRLLKSAQDGPRGHGGLGTIMTFMAGGALLSLSPMVGAFTNSIFGPLASMSYPALAYSEGMSSAETGHVTSVMAAVLQFMTLLGIVSVARGIFIVRGVAEGNSQASMMAGITHLVGGALAVNLGPLLNAVQSTLGISQYGVNF